jgi:hypothetical protein
VTPAEKKAARRILRPGAPPYPFLKRPEDDAGPGPRPEPEPALMTMRTCIFSGCKRSVDLPDVILTPPEGWRHIWTSVASIEDRLYCEPYAEVIERRIAQAHGVG